MITVPHRAPTDTGHDADSSRAARAVTAGQRLAGRARLAQVRARRLTPPQWAKTAAAVGVWILLQPLLTTLTCTYPRYMNGFATGYAMCVLAAVAAHAWPTWTSPWRTIAWAWAVMAGVGSTGLLLGWGGDALTACFAAALLVVVARANQNARRVGDLLVRWRQSR